MSRTSDITVMAAAALIAIATGSAVAQSANNGVAQDSSGAVQTAPAPQQTAPRANDTEANDDTNAYAPDQVTGVNGSGNPGATGPGGAHDSRSGNGWNAGPRSNVGGPHND